MRHQLHVVVPNRPRCLNKISIGSSGGTTACIINPVPPALLFGSSPRFAYAPPCTRRDAIDTTMTSGAQSLH